MPGATLFCAIHRALYGVCVGGPSELLLLSGAHPAALHPSCGTAAVLRHCGTALLDHLPVLLLSHRDSILGWSLLRMQPCSHECNHAARSVACEGPMGPSCMSRRGTVALQLHGWALRAQQPQWVPATPMSSTTLMGACHTHASSTTLMGACHTHWVPQYHTHCVPQHHPHPHIKLLLNPLTEHLYL